MQLQFAKAGVALFNRAVAGTSGRRGKLLCILIVSLLTIFHFVGRWPVRNDTSIQ